MQYNVNEIDNNYYSADSAVYNKVKNTGMNNYYVNNYQDANCNQVSALSQKNISNDVRENIDIGNGYNDYYSQFNNQNVINFYDTVNYNQTYEQYSPYMEKSQSDW